MFSVKKKVFGLNTINKYTTIDNAKVRNTSFIRRPRGEKLTNIFFKKGTLKNISCKAPSGQSQAQNMRPKINVKATNGTMTKRLLKTFKSFLPISCIPKSQPRSAQKHLCTTKIKKIKEDSWINGLIFRAELLLKKYPARNNSANKTKNGKAST